MLEALEYVGVLAIEFFECEGKLLANELASECKLSGVSAGTRKKF